MPQAPWFATLKRRDWEHLIATARRRSSVPGCCGRLGDLQQVIPMRAVARSDPCFLFHVFWFPLYFS
jgi:hypothetical protein